MRRTLATAICLSALAIVPVSQAQAASLKGQVVGTPYVAGSKSAVPVLLTRQSARKARLRSPLGLLLVSRSRAVPVPGGSVVPGRLRVGDRFSATSRVSRDAKRAVYPRLTARALKVSQRGTSLSNDELYVLVAQLRGDLNLLQSNLATLTNYTVGEFAKLRGDLDGLRSLVDSLRQDVNGLQSELDDLRGALDAIEALLPTLGGGVPQSVLDALSSLDSRVSDLESDVGGLLTGLGALSSDVSTLQGQMGTAQNDISNLQGLVNGALGDISTLQGQMTAAQGGISNLQGQMTTAQGDISTLQGQMSGALANISTLQGQMLTALAGIGGSQSTITNLQNQATALTTQFNALNGQINGPGGIQADVNDLCADMFIIDTSNGGGGVPGSLAACGL
jgi:predicted  nucleic acid-binding Zn-ribbon protein